MAEVTSAALGGTTSGEMVQHSEVPAEIGLFAPSAWPNATRETLRILGSAAEERGFSAIWVPEHVATFESRAAITPYGETGTFDPLVLLTYIAAYTERIRLGTAVALISQRHPLFFAKEIASLDQLSGGRVDVGAGVGWIREEFQALGLRREDRGRIANRNLELLMTLWTDPVSEYHGPGFDLAPCRAYPKPVQQPHPPLYIGGYSDAALRRVARFGQGWFPFGVDIATFSERRTALEGFLRAEDRRIGDIRVVVCPYRHPQGYDAVCRYLDAGARQVVLNAAAADGATLLTHLDTLAELVVTRIGSSPRGGETL
jgi:probable F420-dependent oxidoreductase